MLSFTFPGPARLEQFLASQRDCPFSYDQVGATHGESPAGFVTDQTRICLGRGTSFFHKAQSALRNWRHFELGWINIWPAAVPVEPGQVVAVVARLAGLAWLNACRIVYVIDEPHRFGFAYGTLPEHAERGEERFLVEHDPRDDRVWYDIRAFSRPNHLLTRLGYPVVRSLQHRFARDSFQAMVRAVADPRN